MFLAAKIREVATDLIRLVERGGGSAIFDETAKMLTIDGKIMSADESWGSGQSVCVLAWPVSVLDSASGC